MANALTSLNPEVWSKRMQLNRERKPVYRAIVSFEEQSGLRFGDTVHRSYKSTMYVDQYTKGTDITRRDVTTTDESMTIDQKPIVSFYIDEIDRIQNSIDAQMEFADDASDRLERYIDAQILGEVVNADSDIDDGDIGGTDGNAAVIGTSTIVKLFAAAAKKLTNLNVGMERRYAVISPSVYQILVERIEGKDTNLGDTVGKNGKVGTFMGFELYLSTNLYTTATWTPADNPTDGDTLTVGEITWTFKATPASAGDIDIGGSTAATLDNLVAALNASGTGDGSDYMDLTDENRAKLMGLVATDGTTSVSIAWEGGGEATLTASESADVWSLQTIHCMFGQKGAIDMVFQKDIGMLVGRDPDRLGTNIDIWALYGFKTYDEGDQALVDVKVDLSQL